MSWRTAVAAAAMVLGVTLASGPMYRSSIATAALQREVDDVCAVDVGLSITVLPAPGPRLHFSQTSLGALATHVPDTDPPIVVEQTSPTGMAVVGHDDAASTQAVVLHRDGQEGTVTPTASTLTGHDALVPATWAGHAGVAVGDTLTFGPDAPQLRVAGLYGEFDAGDPSSPWCGQRTLFAPGPFGDPAAPVILTAADVIDEFHAAGVAVTGTWELPTRSDRLHEDNARAVIDAMARIPDEWQDLSNQQLIRFFLRVHPGMLDALDRRADSVSQVIVRTVTPVQVAASGACLVMLVASGTLLARQRKHELQLLVERGAEVPIVAGAVARSILLPTAAGALLGFGLAWIGVIALAPSSTIATAALTRAAAIVLTGAVAAMLVVTAAATVTTYRAVDPSPVRRWWRFVPWELAPVGLAAISWRRVHDAGGVHLSGVDLKGGDALAQAFPVLVIAALICATVRASHAIVRRNRMVGGRLPMSLRLGVRRVTGDVAATVAVVLAGTLATATFCVAVLLRDTATTAARDKAETFVGADMAIDVAGDHPLPPGLAGNATIVARVNADAMTTAVDILAIDPGTFAHGATWPGGPAALERIVTQLAATPDRAPAIVAGGKLPTSDIHAGTKHFTVDPVAAFGAFPGLHAGAVLVVVDARALPPGVSAGSRQIWVRNPPADVVARLQSAGFPVYGTSTSGRVFDAVSFLVVEWSFAGMQALGLVIGSLVVLVQLLVVAARRRQREVGWVVTERMGLSHAAHRVAIVVELALPAAVATAAGFAVAAVAARLSVEPLDPRPELLPLSALVVHPSVFVSVTVVAAAAVAAMAVGAAAALRRANALEVVRGEE